MKWPTARLGEVADVQIGPFGSLLHKHDYLEGGVPLVNPMHIDGGTIVPDRRHAIAPEKASQLANYRMAEGDVILGRRGEMGRCAVVRAVDHGFLCGTGSLIVRPGPSLSSKFLGRLLSSRDMVRTMERASLGTTMPNLNQAIVANLHFPLPPLTEQRRIAAILDQADEVRSQKRRLRSAVGALGMSIFADMFGTARATTTLGECGEVQGGLQVSAKRVGLALELPYLRVANVYRGRLDLAEVKTIRAGEAEAARTRLEPGDLLVVEGHGNPNEVGRVALWDGSIPNCVHQNHLIRVRLNKEILVPDFAVTWFNSAAGAKHFRQAGKTTSGLNTISASQVRSAPTPIPPINEQQRFSRLVQEVDSLAQDYDRSIALADKLFSSIQSRAFSGQL